MDQNEITMFMDAKVDIQDKRPESNFFKQWTRCQVKIEAVKCLPCFLRVTLEAAAENSLLSKAQDHRSFITSINVPGISITLASSRTKQHSYALFWSYNRRSCHIYFALDSELSCRRHMKWIKKSIKNLELHRMLLLVERRTSMEGAAMTESTALQQAHHLPGNLFEDNNVTWSQRVSDIYEEIFEGNEQRNHQLSRRCSRTSIASGIYEEMRAPINSANIFDSINEEFPNITVADIAPTPPPLPPFPTQRKRFNTFETEEKDEAVVYDEIPRCSTNPETDLAKKKKYKTMLDNIFHTGLRSKRTVSISDDNQEQSAQISSKTTSKSSKSKNNTKYKTIQHESPQTSKISPITSIPDISFENILEERETLSKSQSKRNSFSSPDLSKINFIDTFDEQRIADLLHNSFSKCEELNLANCANLDESEFLFSKVKNGISIANKSFDDHNISGQIPNNFNFSACNSSGINLIAPLSSKLNRKPLKNKIILDDLSGYCVMAPIVKKMSAIDNTPLRSSGVIQIQPLESTSSGYSTGSYSSSTSSCTNSTEDQQLPGVGQNKQNEIKEKLFNKDEGVVVYENIQHLRIAGEFQNVMDFSGNLYENLLAIKAAQELEQEPLIGAKGISTSTPTESPLLPTITTPTQTVNSSLTNPDDESFYQTPRKSIISIDEKIPSYYPNSCETSAKSRRSSTRSTCRNTNAEKTPTSTGEEKSNILATATGGLTQLMSAKLRRERKENLYLTSPQGVIEQRNKTKMSTPPNSTTQGSSKLSKSKKTAAHKISENVYTVTHRLKKSGTTGGESNCLNNNNIEGSESKDQQLQSELLQLAILQKIDFKFEDTKSLKLKDLTKTKTEENLQITNRVVLSAANQFLSPSPQDKLSTIVETKPTAAAMAMTQSTITNTNNSRTPETGGKKFASLPRFKKFDLSPLRMRINNVLQRNHTPDL